MKTKKMSKKQLRKMISEMIILAELDKLKIESLIVFIEKLGYKVDNNVTKTKKMAVKTL